MKYAVLSVNGHQYKIEEGQSLEVEKLDGKSEDKITLGQVMLLVNGEKRELGNPYLENVKVQAKIVDQKKGEKIRVATFKSKSRYRRVKGHRKQITKILIEKISAN